MTTTKQTTIDELQTPNKQTNKQKNKKTNKHNN